MANSDKNPQEELNHEIACVVSFKISDKGRGKRIDHNVILEPDYSFEILPFIARLDAENSFDEAVENLTAHFENELQKLALFFPQPTTECPDNLIRNAVLEATTPVIESIIKIDGEEVFNSIKSYQRRRGTSLITENQKY